MNETNELELALQEIRAMGPQGELETSCQDSVGATEVDLDLDITVESPTSNDQYASAAPSSGSAGHKFYSPRNALVVADQGDIAGMIAKALKDVQGIEEVEVVQGEIAAIARINQRYFDVLVTGPGYDNIVGYMENRNATKATVSFAVSKDEKKADKTFGTLKEMTDYMHDDSAVRTFYMCNEDANKGRQEEDILMRNLERKLRS